ncbi:MAG TPA: ribonuclease H-like domain-containing protein, partial [Chromatiaceae bacterium]|nr:ribonuclease H-like domain-containing protein [Chromatiaceae bacterium]
MGFEDRLRRVRGEAATPPPTLEPAGHSLSERLARLQAARRPKQTAQEQTGAADPQALAEALGGELAAPGLVRVERRIPLTQPQGRIALGDGLAAMAGLVHEGAAGPPPSDPELWRLLDTETSGLAGGTGTWVFACGIGRVAGSLLVLEQYVLASLDAEAAFLAAVSAALAGARGLVSYNGKSFDLPLLATRLGLSARGVPSGHVRDPSGPAADEVAFGKTLAPCLPEGIPHLDLLLPIRRAFSPVWPDCRLATAEARLLGLVRRGDLPGALAPAAWLDWLRRGRTHALGDVLAHNRQDILSLAALAAPLSLTLRDPARTGADPTAVAAWHQDRGDARLALAVLEANRGALPAAGHLRLARLRARS